MGKKEESLFSALKQSDFLKKTSTFSFAFRKGSVPQRVAPLDEKVEFWKKKKKKKEFIMEKLDFKKINKNK